MSTIYQATTKQDFEKARTLTLEYLSWVVDHAREFLDIKLDVDAMLNYSMANLDDYLPPQGRLLLADVGGDTVGVVFMKPLRKDCCEIKRMYVRSGYRGKKIGYDLLTSVIDEAKKMGNTSVLLDSIAFMDQAHSLYRAFGFEETEHYPESEVGAGLQDHMVYMRLAI
jgi:GNAT superfamily N-acetyltransferase